MIRLLGLSFLLILSFSSCGLLQPISTDGGRTTTSRTRSGESPSSGVRAVVVQEAQDLLGTRYKYGGNNPREGFDCSGLTVWTFQQAGLNLPRTSRTQAVEGERVRENQARPGDLVYFRRNGSVFHVALITDVSSNEMWVIHSTSSRGVIREDVLASSYWRPKIAGVRNVIGR